MARKKKFSIPFQPEPKSRAGDAGGRSGSEPASGGQKTRSRTRVEFEEKSIRVNVRLAVVLLAMIVAVAAAAHWVHTVQVRRSGETLLARANAHHSQGDLQQAIRYLRRYVDFVPNDIESLATLSTLLEETADDPQDWLPVFLTNERVLRLDPSRSELRDRQVKIAIRLGRFRDARVHLNQLLNTGEEKNEGVESGNHLASPANAGELYFLRGMSYEAEGNFVEAAKDYRSAIDRGFQGMEWFDRSIAAADVYVLLANLYREQLKQPEETARLFDEMIAADPTSWEAYLARAGDRIRNGDLEKASQDVERASQIAPDQPEVVLLTAQLVMRRAAASQADVEAIRQRLQQVTSSHPEDHRLYRTLAQLELNADRTDQAVEVLRDGIEQSAESHELIWMIADTLISSEEIEEAKQYLNRLRKVDVSGVYVDYVEARILKSEGNLREARRHLEQVRTKAAKLPELAVLAGVHLAECHGQMANFEEQLDAARQAVDTDPNSLPAHFQLASALHSLGRLNDALEQYAQLAALPDVMTQMARILFEKNLRKAADERDWQTVEKALDAAERTSTNPAAIQLLRVQVLQAAGDQQQAREHLQRLQTEHPADAQIWATRVLLAVDAARREEDAADSLQEAESLLEEAYRQVGDCLELRLAGAALWSRLGTEEAESALTELEENLDQLSRDEQGRLLEELANIRSSRGDVAGAHRLWGRITGLHSDHVRAQFRWFALSQQSNNTADMEQALERLRKIEGGQGPYVTCAEALTLIDQARAGDTTALDEARSRLSSLDKSRPNWQVVPLCLARIDEFEGNLAEAAKNYRQAVDLGFKDPIVILRAVYLLMEPLQQPDEAERLLDELRDNPSPHVQALRERIAAHIALAQGDAELALEQALAAVDPESPRAADYVWLGQLQVGLKKTDDAEQSYRKAIELAPSDPAPYVALVRLLAAADRLTAAEAVVDAAGQKLPPESANLALANCYEAMGRFDQAAERYRQAMSDLPDRIDVVRQAAEFLLRIHKAAEAEPLLKRIIDPTTVAPREFVIWARRTLASLIGGRSYPDFLEARRLLDANINEIEEGDDVDRLMNARLLASRREPSHRRTAIQILDALNQRTSLSAPDQLLLANLHDSLGEVHRASMQWRALVNAHDDQPAFIAAYVRRQLQQKQYDDAGLWLESLEKLQPSSFATVELKARLAFGQGDDAETITLLDQYVQKDDPQQQERSQRLALTARLLDTLTQRRDGRDESRQLLAGEVERRYREVIEQRTDELLPFANFLARQDRLVEALDLCQQALDSSPPLQVTAAAVGVLRQAGAMPQKHDAQILRVQGWLDEALEREPGSVLGLLQRAEIFDLRGRYSEAEETYYQILERSKGNVIALNNLAWLLSVRRGRHEEADEKINRAIETAGFMASLLDTRGTIQLNQGQIDRAIESFQEAISLDDNPTRRFHLAVAFWKSNQRVPARANLKQAQQQGFDRRQLHPLEHDLYSELMAKLSVE